MTSPGEARRARLIAALIGWFYAGAIADWWLRERATTLFEPEPAHLADAVERPANRSAPADQNAQADRSVPSDRGAPVDRSTMTSPSAIAGRAAGSDIVSRRAIGSTGSIDGTVDEIARHNLRLPIDGADIAELRGSFDERRAPDHAHEAVDIPAPRNTPIHAVDDGSIAKLFLSKAGGRTIYQFDSTTRFSYYYAHLERYADGLREGQQISRGEVIGYVGTSGNAPPGAPHLHFAVFELTPQKHWWQGRAVDPYLVFHR
jgi:peptidoglycan LD-endopeptidase LytH